MASKTGVRACHIKPSPKYLARLRKRYAKARKKEQSAMLDESMATTGYRRKHAVELLAGAVLLGTLMFVCLGYTIAGLVRSTESAMAVSQLINFPMMMLSGSIFDSEILPPMFRPIVDALPLTYLSDLLRQTMAGMTPMHPLSYDFAIIGIWFVVLLVLSVKLWKWE